MDLNSFKVQPTRIEGAIVNTQNGVTLKLELIALKYNMLRMKVNELNPTKPRFEPKEALISEPEESEYVFSYFLTFCIMISLTLIYLQYQINTD